MESTYSTELWLSHSDEPHPDSELQSRIWEALHARHIGDRGGLFVHVTDRVVSLTGTVPSERQAREVAEVVTGMDGVRQIVNRMVVGPGIT